MKNPIATAYIEGVETEVVLGMGATEFLSSERIPYTVVLIMSPTAIVVKRDRMTTNPDGSQSCQYDRDGESVTLTKRDDRRWRRSGVQMGVDNPTFGIGQRQSGIREEAA